MAGVAGKDAPGRGKSDEECAKVRHSKGLFVYFDDV